MYHAIPEDHSIDGSARGHVQYVSRLHELLDYRCIKVGIVRGCRTSQLTTRPHHLISTVFQDLRTPLTIVSVDEPPKILLRQEAYISNRPHGSSIYCISLATLQVQDLGFIGRGVYDKYSDTCYLGSQAGHNQVSPAGAVLWPNALLWEQAGHHRMWAPSSQSH